MTGSIYDGLKDHFRNNPNVVVAEGKGAQGLKHKGKMFAMFYKGGLIVKLNPKDVITFIQSGKGLAHDPGTGKPMKDRLLVPESQKAQWIEFCKISLAQLL